MRRLIFVLGLSAVAGKLQKPAVRDRAERQTPLVQVAPAPLPSGLPLTGVEGHDSDGYPTRYVDRPALRSLLAHQRYQELSSDFDQLQSAFEADPKHEYWPIDAGDAF